MIFLMILQCIKIVSSHFNHSLYLMDSRRCRSRGGALMLTSQKSGGIDIRTSCEKVTKIVARKCELYSGKVDGH